MRLDKILGMMEDYVKVNCEAADSYYNNIKEQADNGNKDAQTVIKFGSEKEIKQIIHKEVLK